ncbi:hypothetical protein K0T47_001608 [Campylobacter jejuni]|uniref:GP-PDE domain-containing protein n=1 Tax=Campylobacter jejuni TaxID=197 RepID=A0A5T0Z7H5_CAMJU|nr:MULTISPECIES: hypothetical protein [Campylobacter]EAH6307583.1 hypothetical protein [Campylobacter jejuni]EAH7752238.1 hypothetical protein [Campylobacter jejuni]EAH8751169.1 hypothetical protein [Campylobacter jejuni]EAI4504470.1 hypothetical protein [Campylobacter jejuni]EAI4552017.1 hypothetical protein [Campylobacter jejuni]
MVFLHRQNNISKKIENFGVEIDLRRNEQGLVLNHDLLESNIKYPLFTEKLEFFENIPIICNIKESNLEELVIDIFNNYGNNDGGGYEYYFLDSQIPDILRISKKIKGKFIIRVSDVETLNCKLIELSKPRYLWVDYSQFADFDIKEYAKFINNLYKSIDKKIEPIIVSPELYNLSYTVLIQQICQVLPNGFSVCTKNPELWGSYV